MIVLKNQILYWINGLFYEDTDPDLGHAKSISGVTFQNVKYMGVSVDKYGNVRVEMVSPDHIKNQSMVNGKSHQQVICKIRIIAWKINKHNRNNKLLTINKKLMIYKTKLTQIKNKLRMTLQLHYNKNLNKIKRNYLMIKIS